MLLCSTSATNICTSYISVSDSDNHYVIHECYYVAHQQVTHSVSDNHVIHECYYSATNTAQVTHSVSDNHYVIHECYYVAHQQPTLHKLQ